MAVEEAVMRWRRTADLRMETTTSTAMRARETAPATEPLMMAGRVSVLLDKGGSGMGAGVALEGTGMAD